MKEELEEQLKLQRLAAQAKRNLAITKPQPGKTAFIAHISLSDGQRCCLLSICIVIVGIESKLSISTSKSVLNGTLTMSPFYLISMSIVSGHLQLSMPCDVRCDGNLMSFSAVLILILN